MSGKPKDLGIPPEARKAANHPISRKTRKSQLGRGGHDPDVALGHAAQGYQGFAICVTFISAILYRPQTREAAAKMRAEIRAARLLARISHRVKRIEAPNQRKFFCEKDFAMIRGAPRCRQSVAQNNLILEWWKAALWKRPSMPDW
jgi:hypothetical protein